MRDRPLTDMQLFYQKLRSETDSVDSKKTYTTLEADAAIALQRAYRKKRTPSQSQEDFLRPVHLEKALYQKDFLDFVGSDINNHKVKRSIDLRQTKKLAEALARGDWNDETLIIPIEVYNSMQRYLWLAESTAKTKLPPRNQRHQVQITIPFLLALDTALQQKALTKRDALRLAHAKFEKGGINAETYFHFMLDKQLLNLLLPEESIHSEESVLFNIIFENDKLKPIIQKKIMKITTSFPTDMIHSTIEHLSNLKKPLDELIKEIDRTLETLPMSPYLFNALSAYSARMITREQLDTIITRHQLAQHVGEFKMIPLLDNDGNFSIQFKNYFNQLKSEIALHSNKTYAKVWYQILNDQETQEKFRLNLAEIPKSERFLFIFNDARLKKIDDETFLTYFPDILALDNHGQRLIFASGAADALGVAIYGPEHYIKAEPRLGHFSIDDIEAGLAQHKRYKATPYPGGLPTYYVHQKLYSLFSAGTHDKIHATVQSMIPADINIALDHMIDISREMLGKKSLTKEKWSAEIWNLVDRAFDDILTNPKIQLSSHSDLFYQCLMEAADLQTTAEQFSAAHPEVRDLGFLINGNVLQLIFALNITAHPQWWEERKINANDLTDFEPFLVLWDHTQEIFPIIKNDDPALQIIKLAFYAHFKGFDKSFDDKAREELFKALENAYKNDSIKIEVSKPGNRLKITHLDYLTDDIHFNHADFIKLLAEQSPTFKP